MTIQAEMEPLRFLIGSWKTTGSIIDHNGNRGSRFMGTDTYEWILDGRYMLHKVDVTILTDRIEAVEIIGEFDRETKRYKLRSFDNKGTFTEMQGYIDAHEAFHILGDKMRSVLHAADSNNLIAHWEHSEDNKTWVPWMELTLSK